MNDNERIVQKAESYLGKGGATFNKYCGMPTSSPWCNAFVCYIFNSCGLKNLYYGGKTVVYCPTSIKWCQTNLAQIPPYIAMPGDVIYFDWNLNGAPDHIGFVRARKDDQSVYTIEGNTDGGKVAKKTRTAKYIQGIFRPLYKASFDTSKALSIDGQFGYNSIACLQKALKASGHYAGAIDGQLGKGTVKAIQKKVGVTQDGSWGVKTSKGIQQMLKKDGCYSGAVDGCFYTASVKAFQTWINKQNKTTTTTTTKTTTTATKAPTVTKTKAQMINEKALEYAWAYGTKESVYKYPGGAPNSAFKTAWKKYFPSKSINTGCHSYVMLVLKACGYSTMDISSWSKILSYLRKNFTEIKPNFTQAQLKPGDIRVHKNSSGGYHIWVIVEKDGKYYRAEANQAGNKRYAHLNASTSGNTKKHKGDWLFRAK